MYTHAYICILVLYTYYNVMLPTFFSHVTHPFLFEVRQVSTSVPMAVNQGCIVDTGWKMLDELNNRCIMLLMYASCTMQGVSCPVNDA